MDRLGREVRIAGFLAGALAGAAAVAVGIAASTAGAGAGEHRGETRPELRDVLHPPPLLVSGARPVTLEYDAVCQSDDLGAPCLLGGRLYVRRLGEKGYGVLPLQRVGGTTLAAPVPPDYVAGPGFDYYAVIEAGAEAATTVPSGGPAAPHSAWVIPSMAEIDLGKHAFGRARDPDGRAARARWGSGPGALGLISGDEQATIGPSAFDVAPGGRVVVLDQVNGRLAVYLPGAPDFPRYAAIPFAGGEGDIAVGADGAVFVLDQGGPGGNPVVRTLDSAGLQSAVVGLAARSVDMVRAGPGGAFVHGLPGDMWLPVGSAATPLKPAAQADDADTGRRLPDGREVVVRASTTEALLALARGDSVLRAWRVTSASNLGEVQLVEPFGAGLIAVLRVWTEDRAEFAVLQLGPHGLERSFAAEAVEWAESAPFGRFRLQGRTLYQLRSAPSGAEIVTFELGGVR